MAHMIVFSEYLCVAGALAFLVVKKVAAEGEKVVD